MPEKTKPWRILDLGAGSGCLLLTLLREYPAAQGTGLDSSSAALEVARTNAERLGVANRVRLVGGDWRQTGWAERLGGPFDLVVSNPPYIPSAEIAGLMPEVARFEPILALDGGADGLDAYRLIARASRELVTPGGWFLAEGGEGQASDITGIFAAAGLHPDTPWKDLAGIDRVIPVKH
jgi:release factor glutamine methyltransferase